MVELFSDELLHRILTYNSRKKDINSPRNLNSKSYLTRILHHLSSNCALLSTCVDAFSAVATQCHVLCHVASKNAPKSPSVRRVHRAESSGDWEGNERKWDAIVQRRKVEISHIKMGERNQMKMWSTASNKSFSSIQMQQNTRCPQPDSKQNKTATCCLWAKLNPSQAIAKSPRRPATSSTDDRCARNLSFASQKRIVVAGYLLLLLSGWEVEFWCDELVCNGEVSSTARWNQDSDLEASKREKLQCDHEKQFT